MARHVTSRRLDRLVTLQRRTAGTGPRGQAPETWVDVATGVWAGVEPIRGREFFAAGQQQLPVDARVIMRWRNDVEAGMRVVDGADVWEVATTPINPDSANVTIELMCVAGVRGAR